MLAFVECLMVIGISVVIGLALSILMSVLGIHKKIQSTCFTILGLVTGIFLVNDLTHPKYLEKKYEIVRTELGQKYHSSSFLFTSSVDLKTVFRIFVKVGKDVVLKEIDADDVVIRYVKTKQPYFIEKIKSYAFVNNSKYFLYVKLEK